MHPQALLPAAERVVGAYEKLRFLNYPGEPFVAAKDALTLEAQDVLVGRCRHLGPVGTGLVRRTNLTRTLYSVGDSPFE